MGSAVLASSTFVVISFLLSLFSLDSSQAFPTTCPFNCSSMGQIDFPFSNTSNPNCGLCTMDCTDNKPKIQFKKKGKWYNVEQMDHDTKIIEIYDPKLENTSVSSYCYLLDNFTAIESPLSFELVRPILYVVKCKHEGSPTSLSESFPSSQHLKDCKDYDIFFNWRRRESIPIIPKNLSNRCSVVKLPIKNELDKPIKPSEKHSLEVLLSAKFSLMWYIHPECYHCYWKRGQCVGDDKGKFRCEDANHGIEMKQGGNNKGVQIGAGVGAGIGALLMIVVFFVLYRRRRKQSLPTSTLVSKNISPDPSLKRDLEKGSTYFQTPIFTYTELEEATNNFDSSKELGDGGFGTVYYGKLRDGRVVAVKRLYENNFKRVEQFMNEIAILSRIRHQNLVSLYGCTSRHCRELLLVYEFIPNGTIADHLHGQRNKPGFLTWPIRMNIAIESADALAYLHASDIIHRDVKTNNILLDNSFHVKVADFGLSRLFPTDKTHVSTAPQGTPGYVDPEYYQCYQLTDRSDVYSFGVVLIELISSKPAVDVNRHRHDINLANMAITKIQNHALHELVDPHLGFESDYAIRMMITSVAELAFRCLQQEKEMRPSMMEVLEVLRGIQSEEYKTEKADEVDIPSDDVVLLKNMPPPSPDSVTEQWTSSISTTPNISC